MLASDSLPGGRGGSDAGIGIDLESGHSNLVGRVLALDSMANLSVGFFAGIIAIALWAAGIHWVPMTPWVTDGILLATIPAALMALRLALKAPYKGFRIAIIEAADGQ